MPAAPDQPPALARIAELEAEIAGLRRALQTRTLIGQATGLLAAVQDTTPNQGFLLLVALSQQHNQKLHAVAQQLVELAALVGPRAAVSAVESGAPEQAVPVAEAARRLVRARAELDETEPDSAGWRQRQAALLEACGQLCDALVAAPWFTAAD